MGQSNPAAAPQKNLSHVLQRRETTVAYLLLLPALLFFAAFVIVPMVMGVVTSLFNYTMKSPVSAESFVGLGNYIELFQDKVFLRSMWNTVVIVVVSVPAVTFFSLWVGSAIYQKTGWVRSFFRGVFYLPVVTGSVTVVVVWKWMFDFQRGIFNWALKSSGLIEKNINWLGDQRVAIWCILLILFTTSVGQPIVLYVAALGNVDQSQVEAAQVDGATKLQTFWQIKWPAIKPTTLYVLVITTINSFQCFALIQLLTSGGPSNSTSTVMYYLYRNAFSLYRYGYANAMGVVLAIIIAIFSALQFKTMNTGVEY